MAKLAVQINLAATSAGPQPEASLVFPNLVDTWAKDPNLVPGAGRDGATYVYTCYAMRSRWDRNHGDWLDAGGERYGANNFGVLSVAIGGSGVDRTFPIAPALIEKLRTRNTGIHLRPLTAPSPGVPRFLARWHASGNGPRLSVTTNIGTFACACTVSTWFQQTGDFLPLGEGATDPSSGQPGTLFYFSAPGMLKFDLSTVTGVVQSATLTLRQTGHGAGPFPFSIAMNYIDPPPLRCAPSHYANPVVQGIASTVAKDADLANHPSVLWYHNITDDASITKNYLVTTPIASGATNGPKHEYVAWPEYGLNAFRGWGGPKNQRMISWWKYAPYLRPMPVPPPRELYLRYLLRLDPVNFAIADKEGMKLPGLEGAQFSYRCWHTWKSISNPGMYKVTQYRYDLDVAQEVPFAHEAYLQAGRTYAIEQYLRSNDLGSPSGGIANGINRLFIDGVQVFEQTNRRIRSAQETNVFGIPFINVYHGGLAYPLADYFVEISGICYSLEYVGPPRRIA